MSEFVGGIYDKYQVCVCELMVSSTGNVNLYFKTLFLHILKQIWWKKMDKSTGSWWQISLKFILQDEVWQRAVCDCFRQLQVFFILITSILIRGGHISMGKFQSGFLKKHIIFPDCICFPGFDLCRFDINLGQWCPPHRAPNVHYWLRPWLKNTCGNRNGVSK